MDCKAALAEMGRWRESLDEILTMVESIKRNIEEDDWDERMHNLLNYIEKLDREATIEVEVLKEIQNQGSNPDVDTSRDRFKKRVEEISWEQPDKQGEIADRIEALRKMERSNICSSDEVEKVYYSKKDPYTKQDIKDPVQNMICKHVYDRESVRINIRHCKKRRLPCQCPVSGCPNKKPLIMSDMVAFPKFYDYLKD
uniref:E3 SUMO-protein ligase NSE2 n=1 Tax=Elaeophora elaphi TaxID=1147741 RepID=A0A0R3RZ55_9BILA